MNSKPNELKSSPPLEEGRSAPQVETFQPPKNLAEASDPVRVASAQALHEQSRSTWPSGGPAASPERMTAAEQKEIASHLGPARRGERGR